MTRYKVTARSVVIPSGVIALTAGQAGTRQHNLKPLGSGRFEIQRAVEFKAGEEFGYEGDLPKALADNLEEIEVQRRAKSKPEAGASEE